MIDLWTHLRDSGKPIALYGGGNGADKILDKLERDGTIGRVAGVFVSDGFVRDKTFRGYKIESYSDIKARLGDMIVLVCFGSSRPEVLSNIDRIASENELYVPDVPVYGTEIFDNEYYEAHRTELMAVREVLADDMSRQTFDDTISYKLTGELKYLRDCEVSVDEADGLFRIGDDATFVDLGAYNGDTVIRYTKIFPGITRVYAVEPDERNHRKLIENTRSVADGRTISAIRALVGREEGEVLMPKNRGRGGSPDARNASVSRQGGELSKISVPVVTVDGILKGEAAHFIKFDVEGAEDDALRGAADTIIKHRPQLLLSCYHRSADIYALPMTLREIRDDYKIYMRHLPCVPGWDTAFYCV